MSPAVAHNFTVWRSTDRLVPQIRVMCINSPTLGTGNVTMSSRPMGEGIWGRCRKNFCWALMWPMQRQQEYRCAGRAANEGLTPFVSAAPLTSCVAAVSHAASLNLLVLICTWDWYDSQPPPPALHGVLLGGLHKITDVKVCSVLGVLCTYWLLLSGMTKEGWPPSRIHNLGILPVSTAPNNGLPSEAGCLSDFGSEVNIDLGWFCKDG